MNAAVLTAPAVPVVAAESPDADLVRLCTEGVALATERDSVKATASDDDYAAIIARLDEMAPVIGALVPATEAGLQAKAAFVLRYAEDEVEGLDGHAESQALRDLLRDALRPREAVPAVAPQSFSQAAQTPVGEIAARIRGMWRESLEYDIGGAKRAGNDDDAADRKLGQLQGKAIGLMFDATKLPAATLSDVAALLDIASGELQCLAVACEADARTKKRHKGIERVLYSTTRVVAAAAGIAEESLLHHSPRMAAKLFPRTVMPELWTAAALSPVVLPSPLAPIADQLEQANARLDQVSSEGADAETNTFFDTADVIEQPIRTAADLLALARICRAVWARTGDSDCELRDDLGVHLHDAVIALAAGRTDMGIPISPDLDAPLLALIQEATKREDVLAALIEEQGPLPSTDPRFEELAAQIETATERKIEAVNRVNDMPTHTLAGYRARARLAMLLGRGFIDRPSGDDCDGAALALLQDLASEAPTIANVGANPDAALVRLCGDYIARLDAWEDARSPLEPEQDPDWQAIEQVEQQIRDVRTHSRAGLVAIAEVANRWALGFGLKGRMEPGHFDVCAADEWLKRLTSDTLRLAASGGDEAQVFFRTHKPDDQAPSAAAVVNTTAPTFALIAAEALRCGRQIQAAREDDPGSPFYSAYHAFAAAALAYEPASLAETMTLAAFVQEQACTVEGQTLTEARSTEIGKAMRTALANVVRGIHRFGGVPMSAADPSLDYLGGTAGAGL